MLLNTAVINFLFIAFHYYFYDVFSTNANRPNTVESCRLLSWQAALQLQLRQMLRTP